MIENAKNVCILCLLLLIVVCGFFVNIYINQLEADKKTALADSVMCQNKISEQNNNIVKLKQAENAKEKQLKEIEQKMKKNYADAQKESLVIMTNDKNMTCDEWADYAASEAKNMGID
jgi:hypothetical protein